MSSSSRRLGLDFGDKRLYGLRMGQCELLSNHGMALVCVAREPGLRLRDIADCLSITERSAHRIVCELVEHGYLTRERRGARNHYEVQLDRPLNGPLLNDCQLSELLAVLGAGDLGPGSDAHQNGPRGTAPHEAPS